MRIVLVAAKELALAKRRLAPHFAAPERVALAEAMFRDVLAAALAARYAERVAVVSSDAMLLGLARAAGAIVIDEGWARGLNAAVALATRHLVALGAEAALTVLSDVPMVRGEDLDAVFAALPAGAGVAMVPSADLAGTNVIARRPPAIVPTRFGRESLRRHLLECRRRGAEAKVIRLSRAALDLDVASDLVAFMRAPTVTHTFNRLARLALGAG